MDQNKERMEDKYIKKRRKIKELRETDRKKYRHRRFFYYFLGRGNKEITVQWGNHGI